MLYAGYKIVAPSDFALNMFYSAPEVNLFECKQNEYLLMQNAKGENIGEYKWTGNKYDRLHFKDIDNMYSGKIHPRNVEQRFAFDMLQDDKTTMKMLTGCFGSGKTMLMVVHAIDLIQKGKFDKLLWVRNNIEVKDTTALGSLPGNVYDKLLPYAGPLADHLGGFDGVQEMIDNGSIEIQHLGFIRGRDIKHTIIMSTEAENLTKQHVQLLIGRVGEGSNLWIEGDYSQVDKKVFEENAGMKIAVDKLAGERLFGYVNLPTTERSETARLADKLDE